MQKIKTYFTAKRGSVLAYSLIILAMMVAIAATMSVATVIEKKSASSTDFSVQAYQTADSGVQLAIKKIKTATSSDADATIAEAFSATGSCDDTGNTIATVTSADAGSYILTFFSDDAGTKITDCDDKVTSIASIKSIGTYKDTVRAVQVAVASSGALKVDGGSVTANICDGTLTTGTYGGLCNGAFYAEITFDPSVSFTSAPKVIVSPAIINAGGPSCVAGATDGVSTYTQSIKKTGFRMYCSGSPEGTHCPSAVEGYAAPGTCSWMAVGL